jgi:O-antigen/teichoic acid export membrane protein
MFNKFFVKYLGLDSTVLFTVLSRAIQASGGLFSIFLVLKFLSKDEQGYYYTFLSLLSIQIFFELGLSNIIVQYVAHEFATVSDEDLNISDPGKLSKLSSLLHFFTKWYFILGIVLSGGLIITGIIFFRNFGLVKGIDWMAPWVILSISTGIMFITTFFLAFIEGLGRIKMVAKIRFIQQLFNVGSTCFLLITGAKLYTSGLSTLLVALVLIGFIAAKPVRGLLYQIWIVPPNDAFNYMEDIFPYQWRIAISWVGGFLIFQMFNPVLFAYSGAKAAGQMGATLAVLNGIISLSLSWVSTKVAFWSRLIALKNGEELNRSFKSTLFQSSAINLLAILVFYVAIKFVGPHFPDVANRFIPAFLLALFASTFFFNNIINCWATYLRCFKKEPFLIQASIVGILSGLSTYFLGKYYSLSGLIWGYFLITVLISLPLSYYIFKSYRKEFNSIFEIDEQSDTYE